MLWVLAMLYRLCINNQCDALALRIAYEEHFPNIDALALALEARGLVDRLDAPPPREGWETREDVYLLVICELKQWFPWYRI